MQPTQGHEILIVGGVCGILWPVLSVAFYAAYPLEAGGAVSFGTGDLASFAAHLAESGQRPAVVGLEWASATVPLLLLPFYLALHRVLERSGKGRLAGWGFYLGLAGTAFMVLGGLIAPALLHPLGQATVQAGSQSEAEALQRALGAVMPWAKRVNQVASLFFQVSVLLIGVALIRSHTWRARGWLGLIGAILALPAKLPLGLQVPTNALWTGLADGVWPIAVGIGLLRFREEILA